MFKKAIVSILVFCMIFTGTAANVSAAVISTRDALALDVRQELVSDVQARLARHDVQRVMIDLGVDPAQAQLRVNSLSDEELMELDARIDSLPAGGSVLALIGAVFVVLLILELTGVIDIFKKT